MKKKLLVVAATLIMLLSLNVAAFAEDLNTPPDNCSITVSCDDARVLAVPPALLRGPDGPPDWD